MNSGIIFLTLSIALLTCTTFVTGAGVDSLDFLATIGKLLDLGDRAGIKIRLSVNYENSSSTNGGNDESSEGEEISEDPSDVHFFLYPNHDNISDFQEISYDSNNKNIPFRVNFSAPWKILIHGLYESRQSTMPQILVKEYFKRWKDTGETYNILVVDWAKLAAVSAYTANSTTTIIPRYSDYKKALQNINKVGEKIGQVIEWLNKTPLDPSKSDDALNYAINDLSKVHIIGFSLGAHVAGVAGNYVNRVMSKEIGRITGLDPAGRNFNDGDKNPGRKLKKNDALAVDVIHTSCNSFGITENLGMADFYPNGQTGMELPDWNGYQIQPSCVKNNYWTAVQFACSHNLAPIYYAFSINHPNSTQGCQCGGWASYESGICSCRNKGTMGEHWQTNQTGLFYLKLSGEEALSATQM